MTDNYNVFFSVAVHEIGHLLIEMIIEKEYSDYSIIGIEIEYNPRILKLEKGKVKYLDLNVSRSKELNKNGYELLVESGDLKRIKLTEISLLFGSLYQSMFNSSCFWFSKTLKEDGESDLSCFKNMCKYKNIEFEKYFCEHKFCVYFENILRSLNNDLRKDIKDFIDFNYNEFNQIEKTEKYSEKGIYEFKGLEQLRNKIDSSDTYKELVDLVKNYSFEEED